MKRLVLLALIFTALGSAAHAQDWCLTPVPSVDSLKVRNIEYPYDHEMTSAVVRISVHMLHRTNGTGGITSQQADEQLEWLYEGFAPYNVSFVEVERDDQNVSFYDSNFHAMIFQYMRNNDDPAVVDIYLTEPDHYWDAGSAENIPSTALVLSGDRMFNEVIVHEMGHCLGLYHTFETMFGSEDPDGTNCEDAGDLVCETAACPGPLYAFTDTTTCELTPLFYQIYPDYDPDPTNYMVYAPIHCFVHFEDEQVDRMFATMETIPQIQAVLAWSPARFANYSSDTGLNFDGMPYSSVGFDYDYDPQDTRNLEDLMVTIASNATYSALCQATELSGKEVPVFADRTQTAFALAARPQVGLGGASVADMDNDGDLDMFCASGLTGTPRLYENDGDATFTDVTTSLGVADDAANTWAGLWGDYDRDGWADLFLVRGGEEDVFPDEDLLWQYNYLMRNDLDPDLGTGDFDNVTSAVGMTAGGANALPAITGTWCDVNNDNRLDLYLAQQAIVNGARGRLFVQQSNGTFSEQGGSLLPTGSLLGQTAVKMMDMDLDGDQDLVVGQRYFNLNGQVYWNDGSGDFTGDDPTFLPSMGDVSGLRVWDHDLDMRPDFLMTTLDPAQTSRFYHNVETATGPAFTDETHHVGLDEGNESGGLVVLDWNRDGDQDVYLGRETDDLQFFYRAEDQDGVDSLDKDFICVRLSSPQSVNNQAGIGARVSIQVGGVWYHQWVDGGSGRGGQDDLAITFPVPVSSGTYAVQILWPNGWVQNYNATVNPVDEDPETIVDDTNPTVVGTSVSASTAYDPNLQQFYWVFTWQTDYRSDWSLDKVSIGSCSCYSATEYTPGTGGVTQSVSRLSTGKYQHQLTVPIACQAPCTIPYTVTSAHRSGLSSTSSQKSLRITLCPQP